MGTMVNPYIAGAPVTQATMFFGREDVFQWIENSVAGQYADHILVIHGQRRVGKTSVLKQLGNRLPKRFIPVFFDLQGRTHTTLDRFLWWLAREIVRVLKQERGIEVPLPEKEAFTADLEYFEHRFLSDLQPMLGDNTLLLTFDEFDNLEESEIKEDLARPLIDYLRRLMGNTNLNFIFSIGSSGRKLENMQATYTEFFKTALYKKISFLDEEQTRSLVTRPVTDMIEFDKRAVTRIYQISGGHPYFTQLICHELFAKCQQTEAHAIHEQDVESVLDDVIERGTVNLKFVWDEATDIEKWTLAALAQLDKTDSHILTDFLRKQRVRFSETDLSSGLLHLREKDILTRENRFVIHLMKLWLQKNRPMEQAREELTEVNPIANRYIEIGLEFKDAGVYDKAIESFQEALSIAKNNIQAQVSIALIYMDQKSYSSAVVEFEKALVMDDEDISARSGLCEAHLALGNAALQRGRPKEALQSYQRVLAINAEHTEARQRVAEIACQRAEKALSNGRDEEALSAFAEALKYTPEDPTLVARVEQVRAEKKTKVLTALLARSDKEASTANWEAALKSLEEALLLAPEDITIQKKRDEIRAAQEKSRLDALLIKADTAVRMARWDEASEALTAILAAGPDEAIEAKLKEVRERQLQRKLNELKAKAYELARTERFDEALSAWESYRALGPADAEKVQVEIAALKTAQMQAQLYAEAQRLYARKNYDKAIVLLKEIVETDYNYKNASQLLAESIELRRTRRSWWQSRWLWGGVVSCVVLIVGWLAFQPGSPLMSAPAASLIVAPPTGTAVPLIPTTTPTVTASPTITPTPLPLIWTRLNSGQFSPPAPVLFMVVDPTDPGVIYVSGELTGMFRSLDGGISWQPFQQVGITGPNRPIFIDPSNSQIMYIAAAWGGDTYKTTDGGKSWQAFGTGEMSEMQFDPRNSRHMYNFDSTEKKFYESLDGGASWELNYEPEDESCLQQSNTWVVKYPPTNDPPLLLMTNIGDTCGLYRSEDNGHTWTLLGLDGKEIAEIEVGESESGEDVIYAYTADGFIISYDNGKTWVKPDTADCSSVKVDERVPTRAYCIDRSGTTHLMVTRDSGSTWKELSPGQDLGEIGFLHIHYDGEDQYIYVSSDAGLFISTDEGLTWNRRSNGLGATIMQLAVDPGDPSVLYVDAQQPFLTQNCNLYRSNDAGRNWEIILSGESPSSCEPKFDSKNTLYMINRGVLTLSYDRGRAWNIPASQTQRYSWTAADPHSTHLLLAGDEGNPLAVFYSTDSARTWQPGAEIPSTTWPGFELRVFFNNPENRVYAISFEDISYSEDEGQTWKACASPPGAVNFDGTFAMDPTNPRRLFLATFGGKYWQKGGLYISNDACQSWEPTPLGEINSFVTTVALDPNQPNTVYAGTSNGAYVSYDGGQNWGQVNEGLLGATTVYSIVVDKDSNVYAATPYGIFKLEKK